VTFEASFAARTGRRDEKKFRLGSSLLLSAALLVPIAMRAQDRDHDRDDRNQRVYYRAHHDYHAWNNDEDEAYRRWYGQTYNGRQYREYRKLNKKRQQAYWKWRHDNDRDHDRDHDRH
jgi:hypothetical protein